MTPPGTAIPTALACAAAMLTGAALAVLAVLL
jgi:hypothetical protein